MITEQTSIPRQRAFDKYWQTREYASADARSRQRTDYCARLVCSRQGRLVDVGCGRGYTSAYFAQRGFTVLGIDISPLAVDWTRRQGVEARIVDLEKEELAGEFDVIICLETLQYMSDPAAVLQKLRKAMAAGGEIILSLPCRNRVVNWLSRRRGAPEERPYARTTFCPAAHRQLTAKAGLAPTAVLPISVIPPRWRVLIGVGQLAARIIPAFFALSIMYRLVREPKS